MDALKIPAPLSVGVLITATVPRMRADEPWRRLPPNAAGQWRATSELHTGAQHAAGGRMKGTDAGAVLVPNAPRRPLLSGHRASRGAPSSLWRQRFVQRFTDLFCDTDRGTVPRLDQRNQPWQSQLL